MLISVHREGRLAMPQHIGNHFHIDSCSQHQGRGRVSQVVKPDPRKCRLAQQWTEIAMGEVRHLQGSAEFVSKHQVEILPKTTCGESSFHLLDPVTTKRFSGPVAQRNETSRLS